MGRNLLCSVDSNKNTEAAIRDWGRGRTHIINGRSHMSTDPRISTIKSQDRARRVFTDHAEQQTMIPQKKHPRAAGNTVVLLIDLVPLRQEKRARK